MDNTNRERNDQSTRTGPGPGNHHGQAQGIGQAHQTTVEGKPVEPPESKKSEDAKVPKPGDRGSKKKGSSQGRGPAK